MIGNTNILPVSVIGSITDDPRFIASRDGKLNFKNTYLWHILGRRGGTGSSDFASSTVYNDLVNFLGNTNALIPADPAGANIELVSSSANDTLAGTGVQQVRLTYLDVNGDVAHANFNMNGLTAVNVGTAVYNPLWLEAIAVGSGLYAAGNIDLRNVATPTTIYERISTNQNRSRSGRMTVPAGYSGYLTHWQVNAVSADGDYSIAAGRFAEDASLSSVIHSVDILLCPQADSTGDELDYIKIPPLSPIRVRVVPTSTAAGVRMDASFGILLVQN